MAEPAQESGDIRFPEGFLWGAATSAYQVEGSPLADGAGPSIWHRFSHTPGRTARGETGDIACDHYHRFAEDVGIMRDLGLNAYRFSIAWGRILPEGKGRVNPAGVAFYDRLIDLLLANGIQPLVTLYHWDLPAALDDLGGWLSPDIPAWFADYARSAFRAYGDRVPMWATLNEPWVVADAGYLHGVHAPGHANLFEAPIATHRLLRAHAEAVRAFRAESSRGRIGIVVNIEPKEAASPSPEDRDACDRAEQYMNRQYLDPVFLGRYPERMAEIFGEAWPPFAENEAHLVREPIDFLGVNYYTRAVVRHDAAAWPVRARGVRIPGAVYTRTGWEVHPAALTRTLHWISTRYGKVPLYITENGAAFPDPPPSGGAIDDVPRVDYLRRHLLAAHEALRQGVDLRGYFVWSLLDNYEWSSGFEMRFGIVHVDIPTQRRAWKASAYFYRDLIRSGGRLLSRSAQE